MPSEARQRAWDGRLDAERNYRYYRILADRYRFWYQSVAFVIALTSLFAGVLYPLDSQLLDSIASVSALVAGASTVFIISFEIPVKAARADAAAKYYEAIIDSWRDMWWRQKEDNILIEIRNLEQRMQLAPEVPIGERRELNDRCHDEAIEIVKGEYSPT